MVNRIRSSAVLGVACAGCAALAFVTTSSADDGPGFAARHDTGHSLVVPSEHEAMGRVYHVLPGRDAQVTFTSDAPLEYIRGTSNRVVGYAVAPRDGGSAAGDLIVGEFHLPVASLDTGIPLRDEHLQGGNWLNAESHPDIVFKLMETRNVSETRATGEFRTFRATFVGEMHVKGASKRMEIPATITLMPESERTRSRAPGDLMAIRCDFEVDLSDFGVAHPTVGEKVANEIRLETRLFLSTVRPEPRRR